MSPTLKRTFRALRFPLLVGGPLIGVAGMLHVLQPHVPRAEFKVDRCVGITSVAADGSRLTTSGVVQLGYSGFNSKHFNGARGPLTLLDSHTGALLKTYFEREEGRFKDWAMSADHRFFLALTADAILVADLVGGVERREPSYNCTSLEISPSGRFVVVHPGKEDDSKVGLLHVESGAMTIMPEGTRYIEYRPRWRFTANEQHFVYECLSKEQLCEVRIWDIKREKQVPGLYSLGQIYQLAVDGWSVLGHEDFNPEGEDWPKPTVLNLKTGVSSPLAFRFDRMSGAIAPNGKIVAVWPQPDYSHPEGRVQFHDAVTGRLLGAGNMPGGSRFAFSPDSRLFLAELLRPTCKVDLCAWDPTTGVNLWERKPSPAWLHFLPSSGKLLALEAEKEWRCDKIRPTRLAVIDPATGKELRKSELVQHHLEIWDSIEKQSPDAPPVCNSVDGWDRPSMANVFFSPDAERYMVLGETPPQPDRPGLWRRVRSLLGWENQQVPIEAIVIDTTSGNEISRLGLPGAQLWQAMFSADNQTLVTLQIDVESATSWIKVWDVPQRRSWLITAGVPAVMLTCLLLARAWRNRRRQAASASP